MSASMTAQDSTIRSTRSTGLQLEGRVFGGLVLAAFVLYGIGAALAPDPMGVLLVALNSVAVTILGVIGFRLLRFQARRVAVGYLAARGIEAVMLLGGIAVLVFAADGADLNSTAYLLGMLALAIGSVPFCQELGRGGWLPYWFARWGMVGYAALAAGSMLELATGQPVAVLFAIPGGLFEVGLGLFLVRRGFQAR